MLGNRSFAQFRRSSLSPTPFPDLAMDSRDANHVSTSASLLDDIFDTSDSPVQHSQQSISAAEAPHDTEVISRDIQTQHQQPNTSGSIRRSIESSMGCNEPSDFPRLHTTHSTAGYRDGIAKNRELSIQPGFDEGYPLGAALGLRVGYLKGLLKGCLESVNSNPVSIEGGASTHTGSPEQGYVDLMNLHREISSQLTRKRLLSEAYLDENGVFRWDTDDASTMMATRLLRIADESDLSSKTAVSFPLKPDAATGHGLKHGTSPCQDDGLLVWMDVAAFHPLIHDFEVRMSNLMYRLNTERAIP